MEVSPLIITLLRLLHIVAAFTWFSMGAAYVLFIYPAVARTGESGLRFLRTMMALPGSSMIMSVAAGLTTLAGLALYATGSPERFSQTGNMVLGIGALAGLAATIHGGAVVGRASGALAQELMPAAANDQPIPASTITSLQAQVAKVLSHGRISFVLMVIALLGMGSARYL